MLRRTAAALTAVPSTTYHVLFYKYVDDIVEKRAPHRAAHLEHATRSKSEGKVVMGGAFQPPTDGAMLIFKAEMKEIEEFVAKDPYVANGLVTSWHIKPWTVVIGA
ncbi:hypothetical protein DIPPA_28922 [Diplonema papillatum]|nr:hypothetical protein DIPPA_28922 [Diplonema papillatum]